MMRVYIAPYNPGSESARSLARAMNALRIDGTKRLKTSVVINWGRQDLELRGFVKKVLNRPEAVRLSANKIETFKTLLWAGVATVDWTTNKDVAMNWLDTDFVYCRTQASSSQGRGIVVVGQDDLFMPDAPLYTRGFNKTHEYRVHVAFGQVIDYSKKRKRNDIEVNPYVKNHGNGWVFCRDGTNLPDKVRNVSLDAIRALGLDFGALDVLYKERDDEARILEINSAPGIEGSTLIAYSDAFKTFFLRNYYG